MLKSCLPFFLVALGFHFAACTPESVQTVDKTNETDLKNEAELTNEAEQQRRQYQLLAEPWKKYFSESPKLLLVSPPSSGIGNLLTEEQKLIKAVLDSTGGIEQQSDYAELEERLDELKTIIPAAETASGHVPTNTKRYTYVSGNTIYTRSRRHYYNGYYYDYFREKQKSSSPALVRSVQGLVHNATLDPEDLDQRIAALQGLISQWSERTSEMSPNGTAGIMRKANEAYLSTLRDFTKNFLELRAQIKKIDLEHSKQKQNRNSILEKWQTFESSRLNILHDYFQVNASTIIEPDADTILSVNGQDGSLEKILSCKIGDRDLYFEISEERHIQHPFVLVDITPAP